MWKSLIHYLDTNIILAMALIGDDCFEDAEKYLNQKYHTFVSTTACNEAEQKIDNIKRISLKIANFIYEYSLNNEIDIVKIDHFRYKIEKSFLKQYSDEEYPENLKRTKFIEIVQEFFKVNQNEINELLIINNNGKLFSEIKNTFKINKSNLYNFIDENNCISFINCGSKINDFEKIGAHKKDAILLDESYHLHLTLNEPVRFITFDSDIIDLKDKIHDTISKEVTVSSPIEFIPTRN